MTSAARAAKYGGVILIPSTGRGPARDGVVTPISRANQPTTRTTRPTPTAIVSVGIGAPVRSWIRVDTVNATRNAITTTATRITNRPLDASYHGIATPRVLATRTGDQSSGSRGCGRYVSATLEYMSTKIASSGTLRTNSTYHWAAVRRMKFCDSLAMPMSVPNSVASRMPDTMSRTVLAMPSFSASHTDWVGRKSLSPIGNPACRSRNP